MIATRAADGGAGRAPTAPEPRAAQRDSHSITQRADELFISIFNLRFMETHQFYGETFIVPFRDGCVDLDVDDWIGL